MKEIDPPPPLDASADTPEDLRAVMRALGREGPSRATLDRVARNLGPWLDAPPGLALPKAAAAARSTGKIIAARAVAALLAVGGTIYMLQREPAPEAQPVVTRGVVADQPAVAPVPVEPPEQPTNELLPAREPPPPVKAKHHHGRRRAVTVAPTIMSDPSEVVEVAPVALPAPKAVAPVEAAPVAQQPPPAPKLDEYSLLWQARERMRRDPAGALELLNAHVAQFADGQLAPEREVLAVEALRALGRKREADARLSAFRVRYPGSIHLRRLQSSE